MHFSVRHKCQMYITPILCQKPQASHQAIQHVRSRFTTVQQAGTTGSQTMNSAVFLTASCCTSQGAATLSSNQQARTPLHTWAGDSPARALSYDKRHACLFEPKVCTNRANYTFASSKACAAMLRELCICNIMPRLLQQVHTCTK